MSETKVRTLGAIIFEGFELLDLYGPLEMFGCLGSELKIETISEKKGAVASSPGVQTVAQHSFDDHPDFDLLLQPGGVGIFQQLSSESHLEFLRRSSKTAEITMSVCNGSAILAKAGVLDGRRATSNKIFFDHAKDQSDQVDWVTEARWVDDGNIVTSSGVSAGTDMSLAVIARLYGKKRAEAVAITTEYEWTEDAGKDPFSQYLNQLQWAQAAMGTDLGSLVTPKS